MAADKNRDKQDKQETKDSGRKGAARKAGGRDMDRQQHEGGQQGEKLDREAKSGKGGEETRKGLGRDQDQEFEGSEKID